MTSNHSKLTRFSILLMLSVVWITSCAPIATEQTIANQADSGNASTATEVVEQPTEPPRPTPTLTPTTISEVEATEPSPTEETAPQIEFKTLELADGTSLDYAVVSPTAFDSNQAYPILLAMPPGIQDKQMARSGLEDYFAQGAIKRGWIVLSPVAPGGQPFYRGSETVIPEFLQKIGESYRPEGGKYHLTGISNGGLSAFRIAINSPDQFHSLSVLPGYPHSDDDKQNLAQLVNLPIAMFVGEYDISWVNAMQETEAELLALGADVSLEIFPGEGHLIKSLSDGEAMFEVLEEFR